MYLRHTVKKFGSTLCICGGIVMARTFGEYVYSGWNGQNAFARYRWRGHDYFIQTAPEKPTEPEPLARPRPRNPAAPNGLREVG
jgi:hypothetical protein